MGWYRAGLGSSLCWYQYEMWSQSSTICTATDMTLRGLTTWNRVTYYYPATTQYLYFKHFFCLFIHLIGSSICPTCLQLNDQFIEAAFRRQQPSICKIFECDNLHLKWDNLLMMRWRAHLHMSRQVKSSNSSLHSLYQRANQVQPLLVFQRWFIWRWNIALQGLEDWRGYVIGT